MSAIDRAVVIGVCASSRLVDDCEHVQFRDRRAFPNHLDALHRCHPVLVCAIMYLRAMGRGGCDMSDWCVRPSAVGFLFAGRLEETIRDRRCPLCR